jgi:DnaJ-domain-containing protein 1
MSISKRFVNILKSNLNTLLDRTAEYEGQRDSGERVRLEDLSDTELELELRRRRERRDAAQAAAQEAPRAAGQARRSAPRGVDEEAWREVEDAMRGSRYRTTGGRRQSRSYQRVNRPGRPTGDDARLARLYAQLECPVGADLDTVRKKYRILMRKYHPDVHSGDAAKQRLATELSQRLTSAYNELRRSLSGP